MKRFITRGIILARTNFGEADRILTFLTPDHGKIKAIAKGVRKSKSKLAGGIELFSVSDLSLIIGRGEINTLISSRLVKHFGNISKDIERTNVAYDFIKIIDKATEDNPEKEYFELLQTGFKALDSNELPHELVKLWFNLHLLKLSGHSPNFQTDPSGQKLVEGKKYNFDFEQMAFLPSPRGKYAPNEIKLLRLILSARTIESLSRVEGITGMLKSVSSLADAMLKTYVRI